MAIDIEWQTMPPQKEADEGKPRLFPRITNTEVIDDVELANRMATHSGLTKGAVMCVLEDLGNMMAQLLAEGKEINLPSVGSFRLSIGTDVPVTTETHSSMRHVSVRGINFKPSSNLLQSVGTPTFRRGPHNSTTIATSAATLLPMLDTFLQSHPTFTSSEFAKNFHLKRSTAIERLNQLIEMGAIKREGSNKDTKYRKGNL